MFNLGVFEFWTALSPSQWVQWVGLPMLCWRSLVLNVSRETVWVLLSWVQSINIDTLSVRAVVKEKSCFSLMLDHLMFDFVQCRMINIHPPNWQWEWSRGLIVLVLLLMDSPLRPYSPFLSQFCFDDDIDNGISVLRHNYQGKTRNNFGWKLI